MIDSHGRRIDYLRISVTDRCNLRCTYCMPSDGEPLAAAGLMRVNISLDAIDPGRFAQLTRGGDVRQVLAGIEAAREAGLDPIRLNCVVKSDSSEPDARAVAAFAQAAGLEVRFIRRMGLDEGAFTMVEGGSGGDCPRCNLTSDGRIRPCLFSNLSFDVRELGAAKALAMAVLCKPAAGSACTDLAMHAIGG